MPALRYNRRSSRISGRAMAETRQKLTPENVAKLCESFFSMPVDKITAPGGKSRESLRVHFATRNIIATQRKFPGRMRMEVEVLKRLTGAGAPVPAFLGGNEQIFFQADVGAERLSGHLASDDPARRDRAAKAAFESLLRIHAAGAETGLAEIVPALGESPDWVRGLIGTVHTTSEKLGLTPPSLDMPGLERRLQVTPARFIKWDARPGNASIDGDGRVWWFDWEHCGRRQGMEDFAWLAGDEFWPLDSEAVVTLLAPLLDGARAEQDLDYLTHFITFHIVQRLTIIHRRFVKAGWVDAKKALKFDKIGTDPDLARRLCRHGAGWAGRAALTRPMVPWFEACSEAIGRL